MKNLKRITNYYNRLEAWKDWHKAAVAALECSVQPADILALRPADDAGWHAIDRKTEKLKKVIELAKESLA